MIKDLWAFNILFNPGVLIVYSNTSDLHYRLKYLGRGFCITLAV